MYNNTVTYNGLTFESEHDQSYFNRKRKKRLQKKLSVGDFFSVIVHVHVDHTVEGDDTIDEVIDKLLNDEIGDLCMVSLWQDLSSDIYFSADGNNDYKSIMNHEKYLKSNIEKVFSGYDDNVYIQFDVIHNQ